MHTHYNSPHSMKMLLFGLADKRSSEYTLRSLLIRRKLEHWVQIREPSIDNQQGIL